MPAATACAPARADHREILQTIGDKPLAPARDRLGGHLHLAGDPHVREPISGHQQHTRSLHITVRCGMRTDQLLQHRTLLIGHRKRGGKQGAYPILPKTKLFAGQTPRPCEPPADAPTRFQKPALAPRPPRRRRNRVPARPRPTPRAAAHPRSAARARAVTGASTRPSRRRRPAAAPTRAPRPPDRPAPGSRRRHALGEQLAGAPVAALGASAVATRSPVPASPIIDSGRAPCASAHRHTSAKMCPAAAPAAFSPWASVAPEASAAAFFAAPASSTPIGSFDSSHTTPARMNTPASAVRERLVGRRRDQPGALGDHLLRVRRTPDARRPVGAEAAAQNHRRGRAVGRHEPLGERHDRRP